MFMAMNRLLSLRVIQDRRLSASSRLLYLAMNADVKTTAKGYAVALGIPEGTVRRSLAELQSCGWVHSFRDPTIKQLIYVPWMPPDVEREMADLVQQLVDSAANKGESIMKLMLTMLVNDPNFVDNVRFRWTRLGTGHNRLEFDRYYPDAMVAIEFHGRQHFETVEFRNQKSNLRDQQIRDGLKALACLRQQVTLIEIADVELSYETIVAKLTDHLPLLPVSMDRPLFRTVANLAADYANWAREQRVQN